MCAVAAIPQAFSAEQFWGLGAACGNIAGVESLLRLGGLQLPLTPPHVRLTPHEMYDALMQPAILELWADDNVSCFGILRWVKLTAPCSCLWSEAFPVPVSSRWRTKPDRIDTMCSLR